MNKEQLASLAGNSEYGYRLALKVARERVTAIKDLPAQCLKSGAKYINSPESITIDYLARPCSIRQPEVKISLAGGEPLHIREEILVLHYFTQAKGTLPSSGQITYKELPEGINYFPVFYKRAIKPIVLNFGREPGKLTGIARAVGGKKADFGDEAVSIPAFPRVAVTFVLWRGDEEFTPEGNIMFDNNISDYLTNEDVNVLCETIAWKMVRLLKERGDNSGKN